MAVFIFVSTSSSMPENGIDQQVHSLKACAKIVVSHGMEIISAPFISLGDWG